MINLVTPADILAAGRIALSFGSWFKYAVVRWVFLFALLAWAGYGAALSVHHAAAATPVTTREIRADCSYSLDPSDGRPAAHCQLGEGAAIPGAPAIVEDYRRPAAAFRIAAQLCGIAGVLLTAGLLAILVVGFFTTAPAAWRQHRHQSRLRAAARHVRAERRRARRDVKKAQARLGKLGARRARRWGKRWAAERAAGATDDDLSSPGRIDRWLIRHVKPPKNRRAKPADTRHIKEARKVRKDDRARRASEAERLREEGRRVGAAMRADAGRPADEVEAWRQVIREPHENGPLPPPPPAQPTPTVEPVRSAS